MNKLANVIFAYIPKNDDELELKVGDKIEIIGLEEEGWWRGKLRGKIGVFPTNFVQVIESNPPTPTISSSNNNNNNNITSTTNKLSSLFGNKANKNSLSSNSLNSNNSNNNNLTSMNGAQQADSTPSQQATGEDPTITSSERRPKPIRGVGFGDIFALNGGIPNISANLAKPPKPLPADPPVTTTTTTSTTSSVVAAATERLNSTGGYNNTLQKQVPKKPPPPAPVSDSDQAPALPPKPGNQFSPLLQQHQLHHQLARQPPAPPSIQQQQQHQHQAASAKWVREQAEVIYAYEPVNDDELAMEVGDIIDVIDKDIEDAGWWKGELRGKIGVFPDNFVQLIDRNMDQQQQQQQQAAAANLPTSGQHNLFNTHDKINNKPVFAATPKDFTKELENNLQHNIHNNTTNSTNNTVAALLSIKRNKLQQMAASMDPTYENGGRDVPTLEHSASLTSPSSIGKLNHITANRAKGPSRRPPSNVLNKRNQSLDQPTTTSIKKETSSSSTSSNGKDETQAPSLPSKLVSKLELSEDAKHAQATSQEAPPQSLTANNPIYLQNATTKSIAQATTENPNSKPANDNAVLENQSIAAKTSQRLNQASMVNSTTSQPSSTPSWMVELKKAHAEKKRDSPAVAATPTSTPTTTTTNTTAPISSSAPTTNQISQREEEAPPQLPPPNKTPVVAKELPGYVANALPASVLETTINSNSNSNSPGINERKPPIQSASRYNSAYQPKNPIAAGVKSLSSRYSADYNLASDLEKRTNFTGSNSTNNINNTKPEPLDINSTPPTPPQQSTITEAEKFVPLAKKEIEKATLDKATSVGESEQGSTFINGAQYDKLVKQISTNFDSQLSELRLEINNLKQGLVGFSELKKDMEIMRDELKTCQKATENQRKYIKDLVNNLADERKKLASMQEEIDRTLK